MGYHLNVVGHMGDDELPLARAVYERLHRVQPSCLSALANLAELERRRGRITDAMLLLDEAIVRASSSSAHGHRRSDHRWVIALHCARARLEREAGEAERLLELANEEKLLSLVALLRETRHLDETSVLVHRALGTGSFEQRMWLHVAMKVAGVFPFPPPSVHESFEVMAEVDRLWLAVRNWHLIA